MTGLYNNMLELIGNTPIVKINHLAPDGINIYAKLEAFNPMGSVKDRLALGVIEDGEKSGELKPGQTIIEATSGNTGIGLALVCAVKGYPLVCVMAENFSFERRRILRFLGAKIVITPAIFKGTGMADKAKELADKHGWFLTRQFENQSNADMHYRTTGPEIDAAFEGMKLDYWVTGFGTGGTLRGVAQYFTEHRPDTKIVVCEPENSPVFASGVETKRAPDGSPLDSHQSFRTHLIQGWAPDFIPKLTEDARSHVDEIVGINSGEAIRLSQELAQKEGIFTGISAGATFSGALKVAEYAPKGSNILCMLPDTGERYLSTALFQEVPVDMTDEEVELSESTPNYRFDSPPPPPPPDELQPPLTPEARKFVADAINEAGDPVVMFAFEWCEFCWSVRRMFAEVGIEYKPITIDKPEFHVNDWGGQVRIALRERTGANTFPQVFIGDEFVGGCTEVFDAWDSGELQKLLTSNGVSYDADKHIDTKTYSPKWVHPR